MPFYPDGKMDPITEFACFEGRNYAATTRRVYLGAAKTVLKLVGQARDGWESYSELLETLREKRTQGILPKRLRMGPFLEFLESRLPANVRDAPDLEPVRTLVLARIEAETKAARKVSILIRRDLAMLAGLCIAPERDSPRRWPKNALAVTRHQNGGFKIMLWDQEVESEGLSLALLYWHFWRERLGRPEQSRLYRKACAYSNLLFPNSKGEAFEKQVLHDALSRLSLRFEGPLRLTPGLIGRAFIQLKA
jgi:hypothetical protein